MIDSQRRPVRAPTTQADVVLPAQFFDLLRQRSPVQGERRLMIAILEDAVTCIQKYVGAHTGHEQRLFQDARGWMLSDSADPFSFQYVCEVVGLDPAYVRTGIERWCCRRLSQEDARRKSHASLLAAPGCAGTRRPHAH